jgi:hypothetical protein
MAENFDKFSISIDADVSSLQSSLKAAENTLAQFESALKKATSIGEINYLNKNIANLNTTITGLKQQANQLGKPLGDASQSLINFSRIAQDAPYGIMGIANNLNPMVESFQRLAQTEGGTKKALQAMVSGLMGPAGIGVAIGVVSSLAVTFSKEISEFFKGPTSELEKFRDELNKVAQEIYKLIGQEQTKRTKGILLVELITGGNKTQQQEALKQLKKLYGDSKAIQDAKLGADKAFYTTLVNQAAIQSGAVATEKNNAAQLDKLYAEQIQNEQKRNAELQKLDKGEGLGFFKAGKGAYQKRIDELKLEVNTQYDILGKEIEKNIANLEARTFKALQNITLLPSPDKIVKPKKEPKIKSPVKLISDGVYDASLEEQAREQLSKTPFVSKIPEAANIGTGTLFGMFDENLNGKIRTTKNELSDFLKQTKEGFAQANMEANQFANQMASGVTNSLQSAFDALMKGENVFEALSNSVLQFAADLGFAIIRAQLLAYIQAGLATSGTGLAGAAAGGGGILNMLMNLLGLGVTKNAKGGITNGPSLGLIGEAGPEAIMPLSKLSSFLNTSFNAGAMSGSSAGSGGQFVLRGQDLLLAVNRSQKASNIKGQSISLA